VIRTRFATLTHHQPGRRGNDKSSANRDRFDYKKDNMRRRHHTDVFQDRAFSPW
jgi:hypothetical protein